MKVAIVAFDDVHDVKHPHVFPSKEHAVAFLGEHALLNHNVSYHSSDGVKCLGMYDVNDLEPAS